VIDTFLVYTILRRKANLSLRDVEQARTITHPPILPSSNIPLSAEQRGGMGLKDVTD